MTREAIKIEDGWIRTDDVAALFQVKDSVNGYRTKMRTRSGLEIYFKEAMDDIAARIWPEQPNEQPRREPMATTEMTYLRLRAIVLREARTMIDNCDDVDGIATLLENSATASEAAAEALEKLASRPTPGFWPTMHDYEHAMDVAAARVAADR